MNRNDLTYSISEDIFQKFPGYSRGVVLAFNLKNGKSSEELVSLLRQEERNIRESLNAETLIEDPRIASWREAYRSFGTKPAKFRPSVEAMIRRVLQGHELPSINILVDIGNILSLRYLLPMGGHAIDVVTKNIELRIADGSEEFIPFGSDKIENPKPGEVIFVEDKTVLTRRWTWRQANHTLLLPNTNAIEFNVDGLPPVEIKEIIEICHVVAELIKKFSGGNTTYKILSKENPQISLFN